MGGKQKQSQRTKGNVKPSSSGRSAALLGNVSLPAFPGLKDNLFPSFQNTASDDLDPNIDPNFQLVLKKMNKKDAITRVKALQEFSKLVENSDMESLKLVLPVWSRLYCILAGDIEHKVREAANDAHRIVVVNAKRNIAPYLRMLAGPWFVAQFDTYPPAASAAVRSFKDAFPSGKLTEAIVFCQEEILKFISDNLLDQSLSKMDNIEHPEKQDRNVIMCLQGYCHFLKIMSEDVLTKELFLKISTDILQADQFWNLAVDKNPLVRSSLLAVLTLILEKVPHLLSQHHERVVNCVVGRLDDEDAVVLPYLWQTALNIFVVMDNWSSYCKVDSQIFPALWRLLQGGGFGCANTIFPNMLPLLSSLLKVKETNEEKQIIVDLFFQSLREGFNKKIVQQSRSESEAMAQTYLECMRYISKQNLTDSSLILRHLIPVLEDVTIENKLNLLSRGIFEHTSSLLRYWSSDDSNHQYENLCLCFWDSLNEAYKRILKQTYPHSTKSYILNKQIEFCFCLKDNRKLRSKNVHRVRFDSDLGSEHLEKCESGFNVSSDVLLEKHQKYLQKFVYSLAIFYLEEVTENKDIDYVIPICKLLIELNDLKVFQDLVQTCSFLDIFTILFGESKNTNSPILLQSIMELFFSIVKHLKETDAEEILKIMCQNPDILLWLLRIVKREKSQPFILRWLRASAFSEQLMTMSKSVSESARLILMECMALAPDGAFLVNISTVSSILSELVNENENVEKAVFGAHFLSTLQPLLSQGEKLLTHKEKVCLSSSTYNLVHFLFCWCCQVGQVPENIISCLSSGWQNGVDILITLNIMDRKSIVTNLSSVVWKKVSLRNISSNEENNLMDLSVSLINLMTSCQLEMTCLFLDYILSDYKSLEEKIRRLCDNVELILGASVHVCNYEESSLAESEIEQYILLSEFILKFLVNILLPANRNMETEEDTTLDSEKCNLQEPTDNIDECRGESVDIQREKAVSRFKNCPSMVQVISHMALAVSICDILETNFQYMAFYYKVHSYIGELKSKFTELMGSCEEEEMEALLKITLDRAKQNGGVCISSVYHVSAKDKWSTICTHFLDGPHFEYSSEVFLSKAGESNIEVELENLGELTNFTLITYWLKYTPVVPTDTLSSEIVNFISEWKNTGSKKLLYDCDVSGEPSQHVEKTLRKIQFLSVCVKKCPYLMKQDVWDFVIISAAYYAQSLKYLQKYFFNSNVAENILFASSLGKDKLLNVSTFSVGVFDLLISIYEFCNCVRAKEYSEFNIDYVSEWYNVFADDVCLIISEFYISLLDCLSETKPSFLGNIFLQKLCEAIMIIYEDTSTCDEHTKKVQKKIMEACSELIHSSVSFLQVTAHSILKNLIIHVVNKDAELMSNESLEDNFNDTELEIHLLLSALSEVQSVVDIMLAEFSFGDSCIVQPHTDTYSYTAAYLLLWDIVLKACESANSELRYQYANIIRNKGYLSNLLNNLFYLMPAEVLETTVPKVKFTALTTMFSESPENSFNKICTSLHLQHWACWVYYCVVSRLPALVRQWWSDTKPKTSSLVQKATVQYVTPLLCSRELQSIQNQTTKFKNMEVKVHGKAREVVAVYAIDEAQMELVITLPEEYPLATIQVDSHSSSLVGTSQWRNWVKQLSIFLTHQNGSLWDGLLLWKSNLDKRFEGVEECYICFSILHGTNFQIPKLCCKTCKKKFHSPCLYKWFSTSNKSTCPICRNIF